MAAALTILAKQRGDVTFVHQSLYYPVTDAGQDTDCYRQFAHGLPQGAVDGLVLGRLPAALGASRRAHRVAVARQPTSSAPASDAFVIVDENDVLRDEGEAYAPQARAAGVGDHRPLRRHPPRLHDAEPAEQARTPPARRSPQAISVLRGALFDR